MTTDPVTAAIMNKVEMLTECGCWVWMGSILKTGYGNMTIRGQTIRAHRAAYEKFIGPIPDGLHVLHRCDVRSCVNPDHLFHGTPSDNIVDMYAKGRQGRRQYCKGTNNQNAKLTEDDVRKIRERCGSQRDIAKEYGVSQRIISKIKRNELWKHVN